MLTELVVSASGDELAAFAPQEPVKSGSMSSKEMAGVPGPQKSLGFPVFECKSSSVITVAPKSKICFQAKSLLCAREKKQRQ
jgi:hypothetical protein